MINFKNKNLAFTLTEVLVTVVIIGVVAIFGLVNLNKNIQKKQTAIILEQTYAILHQAIRLSEAENGSHEGWVYTSDNVFFETYLKKYLKIQKEERLNNSDKSAKKNYQYKYLNGVLVGDTAALFGCKTMYVYTLSNGAKLFVQPSSNTKDLMKYCKQFKWSVSGWFSVTIDTNGYKKPNTYGKDVFHLYLAPEFPEMFFSGTHKVCDIQPKYDPNTNIEYIKNVNCNKKNSGRWCGILIKLNNWKFPKDYPW